MDEWPQSNFMTIARAWVRARARAKIEGEGLNVMQY